MYLYCITIFLLPKLVYVFDLCSFFFFFQAEDGIRDAQESRGLGDVYKRQSPDHGPSQSSSPDHGPSQSSSPDHGPSQSFENEPSLPGDYQEILPNPTLEDYCIAGGLTPRSRRSTPHSTQAGSSMLVDKRILDVESVAAALNELNVSRQESPNMMQEPSSEIARAAAQLHQTVYEMDKVAEEFFDAGAPCVDMPETVPFGGDCDPVDDD
eukprot:TRINITY_DN3015_c0_g1_i6.p1 TRINITY_DN3015_c0_g1~~TRINITY_DN3015_c0_g1_i6.p1  ORF type:complete len:210 (+),score=36.59 TRINITY_DN3015_c0_g1_i6:37-666(+)